MAVVDTYKPQKQFGNQYIGADQWLNANQGGAQNLVQGVTGNLQNTANQARTSAQGALGNYQKDLAEQNFYNKDLANKAINDPNSLRAEEKLTLKHQNSGQFNAPKDLESRQDWLNAQQGNTQLQQTSGLLGSQYGGGALVNQQFGTQGRGKQALNAGLFGAAGGIGQAQNVISESGIPDYLKGLQGTARDATTATQAQVGQNYQNFQNQVGQAVAAKKKAYKQNTDYVDRFMPQAEKDLAEANRKAEEYAAKGDSGNADFWRRQATGYQDSINRLRSQDQRGGIKDYLASLGGLTGQTYGT